MSMNSVSVTRMQDEGSATSAPSLDNRLFVGRWQNTNSQTDGVTQVEFTDRNGALIMRAFGAGDPEPIDWGEIEVQVFADDVDSRDGNKFGAVYQSDFMQIQMHGWVKLGVLVIAFFNHFTDDSGRASYFDREFFFASESR